MPTSCTVSGSAGASAEHRAASPATRCRATTTSMPSGGSPGSISTTTSRPPASFTPVPHALIRQQVDVRLTSRTVEIFHRGRRVAAHERRHGGRRHGTDPDHMPSSHRRYAEWTPGPLRWARSIRPNTEGLVIADSSARPHPEQGFRTCLGILRLFRGLDPARAEAVSARAIAIGALTYKSLASILAHNLDRAQRQPETDGCDRPSQPARLPLLPLTENSHARPSDARPPPHPRLARHGQGLPRETDANPEARSLEHAEWLGLLLEHEVTRRRYEALPGPRPARPGRHPPASRTSTTARSAGSTAPPS